MNIKNIATLLNEELIGEDRQFEYISIDSRTLTSPMETMFIALEGKNHDGHKFIAEAYRFGVRCFIVSKDVNPQEYPEASFLKVSDGLAALQSIAADHRSKFTCPVVAITGSNGKTIVKEWCATVLDGDYRVVRSPRSYNSQVGVPLSIMQMKETDTMAIFEAGISQKGEMERLEKMLRPTIGIFTCIGDAHQSNFESMAEKAAEKAKLFVNCGRVIYRCDYKLIEAAVESLGVPTFTYTINERNGADMYVTVLQTGSNATKLRFEYQYIRLECDVPFTDEASIENLCNVVALLCHLGYTESEITERIGLLSPIAMRLERKQGFNGCTIINDTYNSDLGSLSIALDVLAEQVQNATKTVILSDILQTSTDSDRLYLDLGHILSVRHIDRFIGIGPEMFSHQECFDVPDCLFFESTKDFLSHLPEFQNEAILVKGSREFRFERIVALMQEKVHQTVMEINLDTFAKNLSYFRSLLKPQTKMVAMVKAYSYGCGSYEIANLLNHHRLDYLAVAFADEGKALREKGITTPIMVMNPESSAYKTIIEYDLEPEIYGFELLRKFAVSVKNAKKTLYPFHLKIDTGMNRLGFKQGDFDKLFEALDETSEYLKMSSIFSHLATADEPDKDEYTLAQLKRFEEMSSAIIAHTGRTDILRHVLNSAGIERFPEYQYDMVRLGIGMYGQSAVSSSEVEEVCSLRSVILQIKTVEEGEAVGYGRHFTAQDKRTIGIVPVGYADGLRRALGRGVGKVLVNGSFAPIVGNICMDVCMIDLTGIDASEGDSVIFFGPGHPASDMAELLGTITYEIFTSISPRVKRVYFQE